MQPAQSPAVSAERFDELLDRFFAAETPEQEQEFEDWAMAQPDAAALSAALVRAWHNPVLPSDKRQSSAPQP